MATKYKRPNSPFWWVKWKGEDGKYKAESTGIKHGSRTAMHAAERIRIEKSIEEAAAPGSRIRRIELEAWVPGFITAKYQNSPLTYRRNSKRWEIIKLYLRERKIVSAAEFTREHCYDFLEWRKLPHPPVTTRNGAGHNTAIRDLEFIALLLEEAVNREQIVKNPARKLGLTKTPPREKPELSDDDVSEIRACIAKVQDPDLRRFHETSFEIALHQGCRLAETYLPLSSFSVTDMVVRFPRTKGYSTEHVVPMHPDLVPFIQRMINERRRFTYKPPRNAQIAWMRFFLEHGFTERGISFHCTRVTFITLAARNGVPESHIMKLVRHASATITRIYTRIRMDDLHGLMHRIKLPASHRAPRATPPLGTERIPDASDGNETRHVG